MIVYPNAKINIGLKVLNKRADGFHNLETLFYPVDKCDILEIVEGKELKMEQYGIDIPANTGLSNKTMNPQDNLCLKAYLLLKKDFDIPPVEIYLHKNIPVGAGLGGGSSDAAHTIIALNKLYSLGLTNEQMAKYASELGSDCAFFIYNKPMLGEGRGEILKEILPAGVEDLGRHYRIELIHPPYFVSTAQAYGGIVPRDKKREAGIIAKDNDISLTQLLQNPVTKWKDVISNDFEETVFAKIPQLAEYKEMLYQKGAVYAAMSGSGSTMFGIFQ